VYQLDVKTLFQENRQRLKLEVVNSESSFAKPILEGDLHRPGLALAGFVKVFTYQRVQIFGNTEMRYLNDLAQDERLKALRTFMQFDIPCIIVTEKNEIYPEMIDIANDNGISIFHTPLKTSQLIQLLSDYMDQKFAPTTTVHGSLVDVYGTGVLFTGRSGIGKSEIALDLVERGHRLVADDVVNISRQAGDILMGRGSELLQYHMEIRGLGIIDVRNLFGINSVRPQKRVEVEVYLEEWNKEEEYERIGLDELSATYLDVEIPLVKLPIFPGKNITVIAEVIALNHMLKTFGHNTAEQFSERLLRKIQSKQNQRLEKNELAHPSKRPDSPNLQRYLERDYE